MRRDKLRKLGLHRMTIAPLALAEVRGGIPDSDYMCSSTRIPMTRAYTNCAGSACGDTTTC